MKQHIFILLLLLIGTSHLSAQTEKGRWQVGTQVGNFTYTDQNSQRSFSGDLTPSAGHFVAKNLLLGIGLPLAISTERAYQINYPDPTATRFNTTSLSYGLTPFVRYYVGAGKLKPFFGVAYGYGRTTYNRSGGNTKQTGSGYYSAVAPTIGVAYFVTRNMALNASLSYNAQRTVTNYNGLGGVAPGQYGYNTRSMGLTIGFQLFFGQ